MRFNVWTVASLVSLVLGVAFYLTMGLGYGSWTDVGVYSVTIVLVGLGGVGTWVSLADAPRAG